MTYSDKNRQREAELRQYWMLAKESWERFIVNPLDPELDNIVDDLDLLREYTDWPMLRTMCTRALVLDARMRGPLIAAASGVPELAAL